jgi:hypothetical protein
MHSLRHWSHRSTFLPLFAIANALVGGCVGPSRDGVGGGGGRIVQDASLDRATNGGTGGGATGGFGGTIVPPPPPADANPSDGLCSDQCFLPGGQFCGRIGSNCGSGWVDCPDSCGVAGFLCGGSGLPNICGASRDSGVCKAVSCHQPGGQYCGVIGGGCGDALDCGDCPAPLTCGGGGTPRVCGLTGGDCIPAVCTAGSVTFCGSIGDGCGKLLDCGACPGDARCIDNVCGASCPLCTQVPQCDGGVGTSVSGIAVTAALTNPHPLPGAIVFIPNVTAGAKLPPLADGPGCSQCASPSVHDVVVFAITGPDGRFVLRNVPAGNAIPIVVQIGAWRRQTTIEVSPCVDNPLPAGTVRLPRSHTEGDIPLTALATGSHDTMECLLRKIGVEDAEFTNPSGTGRVHLYHSTGATIDAATPDESALKGMATGEGSWGRYHQVLLPCEGAEILETSEALANLTDYANRGGRVLATHFSYVWLFRNGSLGTIGTWSTGSANPPTPLGADVVTSFMAGADFATWLGAVGALSRTMPPQMSITAPHADLGAITAGSGTKLWLSSFSPATTQAVSVEMPTSLPADKSCGRVIFSDFHGGASAAPSATFPRECDADMTLSSEEKALEFMLFYLGSCAGPRVAPPTVLPPPAPPAPPPPSPPRRPPPPAPQMNASVRVIEFLPTPRGPIDVGGE